jgi:hypothetical protein
VAKFVKHEEEEESNSHDFLAANVNELENVGKNSPNVAHVCLVRVSSTFLSV